jgi:hypothetical protein
MRIVRQIPIVLHVLFASLALAAAPAPDLPAAWRDAWSSPSAEYRPLQIVHGVADAHATSAAMQTMKDTGLGGIVCNVNFKDYLRSDANWQILVRAVEACQATGLRVWIYDEEGYPSASAGGRVLEQNPALEAQVLALDPSQPDGFLIRRAYEYTHASNNVYGKRRYPNLIDPAATQTFLNVTHQAYWQRLEKRFGTTLEAFFTDEPSLMTVHLGPLDARVIDPVDPNAKLLATVPWTSDLPQLYRQRYGQDLLTVRQSLFAGNTSADRQIRRQFWSLIADLMADRYFGQIQTWCTQHHVASSGHPLWEEYVLHHVPLYGNMLKSLMRMDIPGLDMLSSDPMTVVQGQGWLTATLPLSAALFNGGRKVMTEVSDYSQQGKSDLPSMQATAAWQAAMGVTEFTLYYGSIGRILDNKPDQNQIQYRDKYRAYCDFVARLNALLRPAKPAPTVLLYYPIYDLWAEYLPVAAKLSLESQSPRAQQILQSFWNTGRHLLTSQIPFALVDHELLASAQLRDGALWIRNQKFDAVVLPADVELPAQANALLQRFESAGGKVLRYTDPAKPLNLAPLINLPSQTRIDPASDHIVLGRFLRDNRPLLILVNVGADPYTGRVNLTPGPWSLANPSTGEIRPLITPPSGAPTLPLPARSAAILIGPPTPTVPAN